MTGEQLLDSMETAIASPEYEKYRAELLSRLCRLEGERAAQPHCLEGGVACPSLALLRLRNEVRGFLDICREEMISAAGFTNVRVLEQRVEEADKALAAPRPTPSLSLSTSLDVNVILQAADHLNQLGGGPMEDRLRLLYDQFKASSPTHLPDSAQYWESQHSGICKRLRDCADRNHLVGNDGDNVVDMVIAAVDGKTAAPSLSQEQPSADIAFVAPAPEPGPSCHRCGAIMTRFFRCGSCGVSTEPDGITQDDKGCSMAARIDSGHGKDGFCVIRNKQCPRACLLKQIGHLEAEIRGLKLSEKGEQIRKAAAQYLASDACEHYAKDWNLPQDVWNQIIQVMATFHLQMSNDE